MKAGQPFIKFVTQRHPISLKIYKDVLLYVQLGRGNDYLVQENTIQTKAMDINFLKKQELQPLQKNPLLRFGLKTSPKKFPIKLVNTHNIQINKLSLNSIIHLSQITRRRCVFSDSKANYKIRPTQVSNVPHKLHKTIIQSKTHQEQLSNKPCIDIARNQRMDQRFHLRFMQIWPAREREKLCRWVVGGR